MNHSCYMFIFDNVAGWVDENPPFSDFPFFVSWVVPAIGQKYSVGCIDAKGVDALLDRLGAMTDDRN